MTFPTTPPAAGTVLPLARTITYLSYPSERDSPDIWRNNKRKQVSSEDLGRYVLQPGCADNTSIRLSEEGMTRLRWDGGTLMSEDFVAWGEWTGSWADNALERDYSLV